MKNWLAWPVALSLIGIVVKARLRNRRRLPSNLDSNRHDTCHDTDGRDGDELRDDDPKLQPLEDLPIRKLALRVFGLGIFGGSIGFFIGNWLGGEHDANLFRFVELLVGPCAVLLGASIVAITFASNWEMTEGQAQRRDNLVVSAWILSVFAIMAIVSAGAYAAVAPVSKGTTFLSASNLKFLGALTTTLLTGSIVGFTALTFRIVDLVTRQAKYQKRLRITKDISPSGSH